MNEPYVPPPKAVLDELLDEAVKTALGLGDEFGDDVLDGIAVHLTVTFPEIPAATLGRIAVAVSMGAGAFVVALQELGSPRVPGAMITDLVAAVGARMTEKPGAK